MSRILTFKEYVPENRIDEEVDLSFFKAIPILAKTLTNPFALSVAGNVKQLMDADPNRVETWTEPYRKIFRKACMKFGGAKSNDVNGTCNKPETLQKLAEFLFDPQKGLLNSKEIDKWVQELTGGQDPEESGVRWPYGTEDIDDITMKFVDLLKKTGLSPADLKKTGTYMLNIALPVMSKFYKKDEISKMKMVSSGVLIDKAKADELLAGEGGSGGSISL